MMMRTFDSCFPNAPVVTGSFGDAIAHGTIVEFTECPEFDESVRLVVGQPCKIRGRSTQPNQQVVFSNYVQVLVHQECPVEFENIFFDMRSSFPSVHCASGRHTTFRNCRFKSYDCGFSLGDRNCPGWASVQFIDCVFEDCEGSGIVVAWGGHAELKECQLRGNNLGIEVRENGTAKLESCAIENSKQASGVYAKGRSIEMVDCVVARSPDSGVLICDGGTGRFTGCKFLECDIAGLAIQGVHYTTTATVTRCEMSGGRHGVLVQMGKSEVNIDRSKLTNNSGYGLFIGEDAVGKTTLTDCYVSGNEWGNIENDGGREFKLIVNGERHPSNGKVATLRRRDPAAADRVFKETMQKRKDAPREGAQPIMDTLRARKMAGIGELHCGECSRAEGNQQGKLRRCTRCLEISYCNRDCQVKIHPLLFTVLRVTFSSNRIYNSWRTGGESTRTLASRGLRTPHYSIPLSQSKENSLCQKNLADE